LQRLYEVVQEENAELQANLSGQRTKIESMEKEQEVAFKNLFDEIAQLKKQNEQLRKADHESKRSLEAKDREVTDEFENLRNRLRQQEDHKITLVNEKDKVMMELKDLQERYHREISNLERENENLHRKLNSTFNSALL
jgi:chromosome segregation ATPase